MRKQQSDSIKLDVGFDKERGLRAHLYLNGISSITYTDETLLDVYNSWDLEFTVRPTSTRLASEPDWTLKLSEPADILVREVGQDEGLSILNNQAQRLLGISGEEFIHKWNNDEFEESELHNADIVSLMLPFAKSNGR